MISGKVSKSDRSLLEEHIEGDKESDFFMPRGSVAGAAPISEIHMMEDHDRAYDIWKEAGVRNQILVHFDGHLDFYWIGDHSPQELLAARSSEELDRLLSQVTEWNLYNTPLRELVTIGNFIYPAIKEGRVREFYWVIPDPFWATPKARRVLLAWLKRMVRRRPADAGPIRVTERSITLTVQGCPLTVCPLGGLPHFEELVLLDIDVDYLVTLSCENSPPYYEREPIVPWLWPAEFLERLKRAQIPTDLVTIAYSVNGGYTPLQYKYFGDLLRTGLADPQKTQTNKRPPDTAAEAYVQVANAFDQGKVATAKALWEKMVALDTSYRTVYATPALGEEGSGRWRSALRIYDQMTEMDPGWHVPHFGRGRVLWHLHQRAQAEEALEKARSLTQGPTTVTYWLGRCAFHRGDWGGAHRHWMRAVTEDPKEAMSWYALAQLSAKQGDHANAITHAKRAVALGWETPSVHRLLACEMWQLGERQRSREEFKLWARRLRPLILAQIDEWWWRIQNIGKKGLFRNATPSTKTDAEVV